MKFDVDELPTLGVGASLSFGIAPDPVTLAAMPGGPAFIEYAGAIQVEHSAAAVQKLKELQVPVLYHPSCMNLCGPWPNPTEWLKAIDRHVTSVQSPWLAQDVAICFVGNEPGYSIQLGYFIGPILTRESLDQATTRVLEVRQHVASPLLLEPPPATFRLGGMSIFEWLGELALRTDCGLLLDAGHVLSHQLVEGENGLDKLPLDRVVEVHVAGGVIETRGSKSYYVDAHDIPVQPETWKTFDEILERCPNLKAVCLECEGGAAAVALPALEKIRQKVSFKAASKTLRAHVRERSVTGINKIPVFKKTEVLTGDRPDVSTIPVGYTGLLKLLFDAEARERLLLDGQALAHELQIPYGYLCTIDPVGLAIDAEMRKKYLMSALCRAYPIGAGIIGSLSNGPDRLSAFLASAKLFGSLASRNLAFGEHLLRILDLSSLSMKQKAFANAFIEFEIGLVANATQLRNAIKKGAKPPAIIAYSRQQKKHGQLALPEFSILVELPTTPQLMKSAMGNISAENAWERIEAGLDSHRITAVLRADPSPITVICRAIAHGISVQRAGSGGISPLTEVRHQTVELRGKQARKISAFIDEKWSELPLKSRTLADSLLKAGVLVIEH